ncbi:MULTISPECIES: TauD/TfdA family dioxygenase [Thiorhodovibrio]|uniref:TauD/TfdA family dioxygenase n=1 Tax=Thiorhodovibrio TaxID=61593 RepID=UPI0019146201|nr:MULTISPECIES: TauD/TfdA family dioxygenase [Thiorhodovibrio]MBK5970680.1 hypothetical protein [Thiorhodovibrio winogradskyi]WPL14224.1 Taurine catabolism dioxygenase TauD, TfdA family [Thiorhodovibrio litoralis]
MNLESQPLAPPPLHDSRGYRAWRSAKLRQFEQARGLPRLELSSLAPSDRELRALWDALESTNMVLVRLYDPAAVTAEAMLALGQRLGLKTLDHNPCADQQAVSRLENRSAPLEQQGDQQGGQLGGQRGGEYIPYTDRALGWHTDGYYNPPEAAVRAWMLFCVRPAASGGENALLDPELAYLWLRDRDPALIDALMHPQAFCIPANRHDGKEQRPRTCGPVFALRDRRLLMRFSARGRNIDWHPGAESARAALGELFSSDSDFILRHKLSAGEGYITRNVLHTRAAFADGPGAGRLLLRVRYRDALVRAGEGVQLKQRTTSA